MAGGFIKPKTVDKAMIAADPAAALVGFVSTILAVFGVFEKMDLTADQVTILGGAFLGLMATFRVFYEKNRRKEVVGLAERHEKIIVAHEKLKKATLQPPSRD